MFVDRGPGKGFSTAVESGHVGTGGRGETRAARPPDRRASTRTSAVEGQATNGLTMVLPNFRAVVVKTTVAHTVTYFVIGVLAFFVFDYPHLFAETELRFLMRPTTDPVVKAG